MSKPAKNKYSSISINWLKDIYQDHPNMRRVNALKEELKQEKLQDKVFCQSIKEKIVRETPRLQHGASSDFVKDR